MSSTGCPRHGSRTDAGRPVGPVKRLTAVVVDIVEADVRDHRSGGESDAERLGSTMVGQILDKLKELGLES